MPSNLLAVDTAFPTFTPEQSSDEKLDVVTNYLYMLLEQLRYTLANLGAGNFNDAELSELGLTITKPIYVDLENVAGSLLNLSITADNLSTRLENAEGDISSIDQYAKSITMTVENGDTFSSIKLLADGAIVSSQTILMNGLVTFRGLEDGTTVINGGCIQTGTIDAQYLNLTGAIRFSDLSSSVQNDINDAYTMAEDAQDAANEAADAVGGWTYRGTTYIDGTQIMTGTVSASTLEGGEILLLDRRGYDAGSFTLEGSSSTSGQKVVMTSGAIELDAVSGDIYLGLYSGSAGYVQISDGEVTIGRCDLQPNLDGRYNCGTSANRWSAVYASSSSIVTSDRNQKNSITYDMAKYDALFDRLRPTPYKYNNGTSGRTHLGMIAQDVEEALAACGMTGQDFAGFVKEEDTDGNTVYSLRYEEFVAMCIHKIQTLEARVAELEGNT